MLNQQTIITVLSEFDAKLGVDWFNGKTSSDHIDHFVLDCKFLYVK